MRRLLLSAAGAALIGLATPLPVVAQDGTGLGVPGSAEDLRDRRISEIFSEVREMLADAAEHRRASAAGEDGYASAILGSHEDRANKLLSEAFEAIADAPIVEIQDEIAGKREEIDGLTDEIVDLREQKLGAPSDVDFWEGLSGTVDRKRLDEEIAARKAEIAGLEDDIADAKTRFRESMRAAGMEITSEQADLLLDSVTGADILKIAAAYDVAKQIGAQLLKLLEESGEELGAARRYYAMHTTLIALLAHAQELFIAKVEKDYLPRLDDIEAELKETRLETEVLLRENPTPAQRTVLEANRRSQDVTQEALGVYRDLLQRQLNEVTDAHARTIKELRVADNTLRTVDASFRLREIMEGANLEFEALQALESPGFETVFENRELREKFEELSEKLRAPGS